MADRGYNIDTLIYRTSQDIPRMKALNAFTVTNIGDVPFLFNGKILFPSATPATVQGDSISFGGNENEIYVGKLVLVFDALSAGVDPACEIVYKYYPTDK